MARGYPQRTSEGEHQVTTFRLDISYEGTDFHGYARQPNMRTVQAVLEEALAVTVGEVRTSVAGRTDAGVHAARQVLSFRSEEEVNVKRLERSLRKLMPEDVAVLAVAEATPDFDARFSAVSRTYRYSVLNRYAPDPLRRRTTWHVAAELDREAMQQAAGHFVGTHDFASLCRRAEGLSTTRTVLAAGWHPPSREVLVFEVTAESFCHQMVRSMVALCVEVGRGRLDPEAVPAIMAARDRNAARGAAPPSGLVLWDVAYG